MEAYAKTMLAMALVGGLSTAALATDSNRARIGEALGKPGTVMLGAIYRIALPRTDIHATLYGIALKPGSRPQRRPPVQALPELVASGKRKIGTRISPACPDLYRVRRSSDPERLFLRRADMPEPEHQLAFSENGMETDNVQLYR